MLNASQRRVNKNSLTWWDVLKMSWRCLEDVFQDALKMFWRRLQNVLKTSWRCLEDVFARRLENVLKTPWRCIAKTNILCLTKTSWRRFEDVRLRRTYSSWSRCLLKTRTKDVFRTSSGRLHQDECLLGLLSKDMKSLIIWSSHTRIKSMLPDCFKQLFPKVETIIDCSEIFFGTPNLLDVQACL